MDLIQLVEIHLIDFVKPFLVKHTRIPKLIQTLIHFLGIVMEKKILQLNKFFF